MTKKTNLTAAKLQRRVWLLGSLLLFNAAVLVAVPVVKGARERRIREAVTQRGEQEAVNQSAVASESHIAPEEIKSALANDVQETAPRPDQAEQESDLSPRQAEGSSILVLSNPLENAVSVQFLLDGEHVTLQPGEARELPSTRKRTIVYHRGKNYGNTRFELSRGDFEFHYGTQGWELRESQAVADGGR